MDLIRDFMNATVPDSARYTSYRGGHCCWNTLHSPTWQDTDVIVYNASGAIVYTENFLITQAITNTQIDITKLPPGFYLIEIAADINTNIGIKMIRQ